MTRLVQTLATAAAALALGAALPARAAACERPAPPAPRVVVHVPAPVVVERVDFRRHELRRDYRELELARERFYARWDGRPGSQRRFERWYEVRRAELDRKWSRLDDHRRPGHGPDRPWDHDGDGRRG